jgi:hypothetical protein
MTKVLFIRSIFTPKIKAGRALINFRNHNFIETIFGAENIRDYVVQDQLVRKNLLHNIKFFARIIKGINNGLTPAKIAEICEIAQENDIVFIDRSIHGIIAKSLVEKGFKGKIITNFHNVESMYYRTRLSRWSIYKPFYINSMLRNDFWALKYSTDTIVFNQRDSDLLYYLYEIRPTHIVPISLPDENPDLDKDVNVESPLKCLFLGGGYTANIKGIIWFIRNIYPYVNVKLQVIGKGLSVLRKHKSFRNIDVLSDLNEIGNFIKNADVVIMPVFENTGMKVKTCKALMYGRNIIGTSEVFEGYDLDPEKVGKCCNTTHEFIEAINNLSNNHLPRYNEYARNVYLDKYTDTKIFEEFRKIFEK